MLCLSQWPSLEQVPPSLSRGFFLRIVAGEIVIQHEQDSRKDEDMQGEKILLRF